MDTNDIEKKDVEQNVAEQEELENQDAIEQEDSTATQADLDGPGQGVLDKIASIFKRKKEPVIEEEEDTQEDSGPESEGEEIESDDVGDTQEEEYEEIDPRFVELARKFGWSDDRIIRYAEEHDDTDIVLMTNLMSDAVDKSQPAEENKGEAGEKELLDSKALLELAEGDAKVAAALKRAIEPLAKRLESVDSVAEEMKKTLSTKQQELQMEEAIRNYETAMEMFDNSGISALGKLEDIPTYPDGTPVTTHPAFQEREKVWDVANAFYARGGTFKEAIKNALQWYKGSNLEKDIQDKVIKDLKKQEKRVMPKRQSATAGKTYANEEERKADIINEALRKYNKELPTT